MTLVQSYLYGNVARLIMGGAVYNTGSVLLNGSLLYDNVAKHFDTIYNGGEAFYVMPAPAGHWMNDVIKCEEAKCDISGEVRLCEIQVCPPYLWDQHLHLARIPQGGTTGPIPLQCERGYYGDKEEVNFQNSPMCSGICPDGKYCPVNGIVTPLQCPADHWCNTTSAIPCLRGYHIGTGEADRADRASACVRAPPLFDLSQVRTGAYFWGFGLPCWISAFFLLWMVCQQVQRCRKNLRKSPGSNTSSSHRRHADPEETKRFVREKMCEVDVEELDQKLSDPDGGQTRRRSVVYLRRSCCVTLAFACLTLPWLPGMLTIWRLHPLCRPSLLENVRPLRKERLLRTRRVLWVVVALGGFVYPAWLGSVAFAGRPTVGIDAPVDDYTTVWMFLLVSSLDGQCLAYNASSNEYFVSGTVACTDQINQIVDISFSQMVLSLVLANLCLVILCQLQFSPQHQVERQAGVKTELLGSSERASCSHLHSVFGATLLIAPLSLHFVRGMPFSPWLLIGPYLPVPILSGIFVLYLNTSKLLSVGAQLHDKALETRLIVYGDAEDDGVEDPSEAPPSIKSESSNSSYTKHGSVRELIVGEPKQAAHGKEALYSFMKGSRFTARDVLCLSALMPLSHPSLCVCSGRLDTRRAERRRCRQGR